MERTKKTKSGHLKTLLDSEGVFIPGQFETMVDRIFDWVDTSHTKCGNCGQDTGRTSTCGWRHRTEGGLGGKETHIFEVFAVFYCAENHECREMTRRLVGQRLEKDSAPNGTATFFARIAILLPIIDLDPYAVGAKSRLPSCLETPKEIREHEYHLPLEYLELEKTNMKEFMKICEDIVKPDLRKLKGSRPVWMCAFCGEPSTMSTSTSANSAATSGNDPNPTVMIFHHEIYVCVDPSKPCSRLLKAWIRQEKKEIGVKNDFSNCGHCRKLSTEPKMDFKRCSGCHETLYCSPECQRENWPAHRRYCKQVSSE